MLRPGCLAESGHTPADRTAIQTKEIIMILANTTVEDVERFLEVFGTKGADKRAEHGSKGATVFRDPAQENRMWVLFEWDEQGWANFVSDPEVPPILKEAGHLGKPETAPLLGAYRA
jgi:quinol monooxygenase YgiN